MIPSVVRKLNEIDRKVTNEIDKEGSGASNTQIAIQSIWEHTLKLSMLEALSDDSIVPIAKEPTLIVKPKHVDKAWDFISLAISNYGEWIPLLGMSTDRVKTAEQPLELVYNIIRKGGKGGISRSELYKKASMKQNELDELINTLSLREDIIRFDKKSTGGRPPVWYRALQK